MKNVFFIVGPTAVGKSELAADVARDLDAEIVSADAFQIYRGLNLLTGKPDFATQAKAPHHLIGTIPIRDEKIIKLDPETARKIDMKNRRRLVRALEICLLGGKLASAQRTQRNEKVLAAAVSAAALPLGTAAATPGAFVFRERDQLYQRINRRVEAMFENGVIEEVRATNAMSETASQMIGLREIRELLEGKMSILQCIAAIQQATRRYAKRQLTWFRGQTNFAPLNLSLLTHQEAVKWISQKARCAFGPRDD